MTDNIPDLQENGQWSHEVKGARLEKRDVTVGEREDSKHLSRDYLVSSVVG